MCSLSGVPDVIIIGAGAAGLYCALSFPANVNVLLMCKREIMESGSSLAQGGIAAVLREDTDSIKLHMEDTFRAGGFENDSRALQVLITEGPGDVKNLIRMGVPFDTDEEGSPVLTLEGGHSRSRILHHKDSTGLAIVGTLINEVKKRHNITIIENAPVFRITAEENGFGVFYLKYGEARTCSCGYVVLCCGGIGRAYRYTTNSPVSTGDGIMLASGLSAVIKKLHYIQFHPTASAIRGMDSFLISEAVRGEGAYLLNAERERFMHLYDDRLELAPRDVVSKSIILEQRRLGSSRFYLDISHRYGEFIKERFPLIYSTCLAAGMDMTKEPVPIYPCQHYLMGGIDVNLNSETSVKSLYAAGECAHTGVHGRNRLASNSLLEALVFGRRAAESITKKLAENPTPIPQKPLVPDIGGAPLGTSMREEIRDILQGACFVISDSDRAKNGLSRVNTLLSRLSSGRFRIDENFIETKSIAIAAKLILEEVAEI